MAKRKKRLMPRKSTRDKKRRVADEQPSTSLTDNNTTEQAPEVAEAEPAQKTPSLDDSLSEERATVAPPVDDNNDRDATCDDPVNIISNDNNDVFPDEEEFIFAPIIHDEESPTPLDLCTPTSQPQACCSSTSEIISLISAIVGGTPKSSKTHRPQTIEVINVDDLPDRPDSPIGDDVIEITPGNSGSSSSTSPEIVLNRQGFVDLTDITETERGAFEAFDDIHGSTDNEDDEDELLAPWPVHRQNVRPTLIPTREAVPTRESVPTKEKESVPTKEPIPTKECESSPRHKINCPICMDEYAQLVKDGKQLMSTSCGHVFCHVCIKAAIVSQKRCPTCRKKQLTKNLHPIFL